MWQWAMEFSRTRKARRAAVATISPIVEGSRHRLGGISDVVWSDPYIIGFIVMLISIVAKLESDRMSENALCTVQRRAWEEITEMTSEMMTEELLLLSTERDQEFELGCHNAAAFSTILFGAGTLQEGAGLAGAERWNGTIDGEPISSFIEREDVDAAWVQYFDAHIAHITSFAQDVACAK